MRKILCGLNILESSQTLIGGIKMTTLKNATCLYRALESYQRFGSCNLSSVCCSRQYDQRQEHRLNPSLRCTSSQFLSLGRQNSFHSTSKNHTYSFLKYNNNFGPLHSTLKLKSPINWISCDTWSNCDGLFPNAHHQVRYFQTNSQRFSSNGKSGSSPGKEGDNDIEGNKEEEKSLTLVQRFKKTYKEHGKVLVVVHLLTSTVWFGAFFAAARLGVDVVPLLESWELSEKIISPFRSGGLGNAAVAYLMYKLATPARYTVTIGGTNMAIRYLRKEGRIQPVAKQDSLREMYKEGKEDLRSRGTKTQSRITHMSKRLNNRIRKDKTKKSHRDP